MPPKEVKKIADKLTDSEKKKIKQENKAKANPEQAAAKKEKSDAKRDRRKVRTSTAPNPRRLRFRFRSTLHPPGEVLCRVSDGPPRCCTPTPRRRLAAASPSRRGRSFVGSVSCAAISSMSVSFILRSGAAAALAGTHRV